jgi:hypothetical protein
MYGRITRISWYKVAIFGPNYANYVVQNSTPSYETLYRRTTSRLREHHICIINSKEPYLHLEFAMYCTFRDRVPTVEVLQYSSMYSTKFGSNVHVPRYSTAVSLYSSTLPQMSFLRAQKIDLRSQ